MRVRSSRRLIRFLGSSLLPGRFRLQAVLGVALRHGTRRAHAPLHETLAGRRCEARRRGDEVRGLGRAVRRILA